MNICLYGASSPEIDPVYLDAAYAFGRLLAAAGEFHHHGHHPVTRQRKDPRP